VNNQQETIRGDAMEKLAYLIGVMLGDGGIYGKSYIVFSRDKNKEFCEYVSNIVNETIEYKPKIARVGKCWRVYLNNKELLQKFFNLGVPKGRKLTTTEIPQWILEKKELKISFLQGIYDAEGYVSIDRQKHGEKEYIYPLVGIDMISKKLTTQIAEILSELSIRCRVEKAFLHGFGKKQQWKVIVKGWEEVKKFNSMIGFRHHERKEKIEKILMGSSETIRPTSKDDEMVQQSEKD
jgi:DNA-binding transcriptional regulator WhiA